MRGWNVKRAALASVLWLGAAAQARAEVVTLASLEQRALEQHARVASGQLRVRAAEAEVRQAESAMRPRVGMSVEATAAPGRILRQQDPNDPSFYVQGIRDPSQASGADRRDALIPRPRVGGGIQVDAPLYDFGRTSAAVQAGGARRRAAEADVELGRAQVVGDVRAAYLAWLSAHQMRALATSASEDAARRAERVNALVGEGARPRTDVPPVDADRLLSQLEQERAEGELATAQLALEQVVGEPLGEAAEPELALLERAMPDAPDKALDPALKVLGHQRTALRAAARLQRKQRAPLLASSIAAGYYGQLTQRPDGDGGYDYGFRAFPSYSLGLSLTIPLWDGGSTRAAAEAAEANAAELDLTLASAERERNAAYDRARLEAEHAEKRKQLAVQLLEVCKQRVADTEAGYELGAMQFDQVQQARALLRRAQTEVVMAAVARTAAVLRVAR